MDWKYEIMAIFLLLPIMWWFIKTNQKNVDKSLEITKEGFKSITDALVVHMADDLKQFERIVDKVGDVSKSIGKTVLSNEQIVDIAKSKVWYASEKKLNFIKKVLIKNGLSTRKTTIEKQLRTELERISIVYIEELNSYTSNVGLVGTWIADNFPMDEFMVEIYKIVFAAKLDKKTKDECIALKIEDCSFVMKDYQNRLWNQFKSELK